MVFRGLLLSLLLVLPVAVCAAAAPEPASAEASAAPAEVAVLKAPAGNKNADPWEKFNRAIFSFNDAADRYVLKPVAKGYVAITPSVLRTGITNFFINLRSPIVIINDVLQGKIKQAGSDTARFVVNSTVGIVGFVDVAVRIDLPLHDEDFGQTLGKWGMKSGPYLMLPFMGPSTVRDTGGFVVDALSNPRRYLVDADVDLAMTAVDIVNSRASLLELESIIQGDRYLFIRDLYLQRREFAVMDGQVDDPFLDDADAEDEPAPEAPAAPPEAGSAPAEPQIFGAPETDALLGIEPAVTAPQPLYSGPVIVASNVDAVIAGSRF